MHHKFIECTEGRGKDTPETVVVESGASGRLRFNIVASDVLNRPAKREPLALVEGIDAEHLAELGLRLLEVVVQAKGWTTNGPARRWLHARLDEIARPDLAQVRTDCPFSEPRGRVIGAVWDKGAFLDGPPSGCVTCDLPEGEE